MSREPFKIFTSLIASINRNVRRIKTEIMAEYDLKCPHVSVLYYLYVDGALTAKQLSEVCEEDKGAISRSVDSLEKCGLIEDASHGKKYKSLLKLTEKGKEVGKYVAEKIDQVVISVASGLSDDDKANLYKGLADISKNLQAIRVLPDKD